jgi:alpha-tubulin suppressor-like RCC1 family protein
VRLPQQRRGLVQGLLGNFDRDKSNDFQNRSGFTYTVPISTEQLYNEWGESWRIEQNESLFDYEDNDNTYSFVDRTYPSGIVSLETLSPSARINGENACRAAGVVHPEVFKACVIDVALTGNPGWANVAKEVDPGSKRLNISPLRATVIAGESMDFSADLTGQFTSRDVLWSSSGGSVVKLDERLARFTAPNQAGEYTVTIRSAEDASIQNTIDIVVVEGNTPRVIERLAVGDGFNNLVNQDGTVSLWGAKIYPSNLESVCSENAIQVEAEPIASVSALATNSYVVALTQRGTLMAWGALAYLEPSFTPYIYSPTLLSNSTDWVGVKAATSQLSNLPDSLMSLKRDGTAWYWLPSKVSAYLYQLKPFRIQGMDGVVDLTSELLLKKDGTVWQVQVTGTAETFVVRATQIPNLSNVVQISSAGRVGQSHHMALTRDGKVYTWGSNAKGQLGLGSQTPSQTVPQMIPSLGTISKIQAVFEASYAISSSGQVWRWGGFYQSLRPSDWQPAQIPNLTNVQVVAGSETHDVLVAGSDLLGLGYNFRRQLVCDNLQSEPFEIPTLIPAVRW